MNNQQSFNQQMSINKIIQENAKLKRKIQSFQEKEKLYQSTIAKLKKYQNEYQKTFVKALKDYKMHEEQIKKTYLNYQKLIENHYKENENRFLDENSKLSLELKQKNNIIKNLNNKIRFLNQKLNKAEYDFQFENKKLESEVVSKEKRLSELNESMIQLARNTNDEIKLLRDEFEIFNNKKKRNRRFQSFQKTDYDNSFDNDDNNENNKKSKRKFCDEEKYNDKEINYLIDKVNLLENQNKNLAMELKKKEEELNICNKLKNELFYNNNLKNYFTSIPRNNNIKKLKLNNLQHNYRNRNNNLNIKHRNFSNISLNEIYDPTINYSNNLSKKYNNFFKEKRKRMNEDNINDFQNYNEFLNDYDINELIITTNQNNFNHFGNNDIINRGEDIKDEYINAQLPKINTLE